LTSSLDPSSPQAARTLKILKDWFQARHDEGTTTKNINTMSVLYSVACLVELDEQRGGGVLTAEERDRFKGWMEDWAEWVMNDLPSEGILSFTGGWLTSRNRDGRVPASWVSCYPDVER
jgi:unsaturated rhamnogalacturonyl hydrolase